MMTMTYPCARFSSVSLRRTNLDVCSPSLSFISLLDPCYTISLEIYVGYFSAQLFHLLRPQLDVKTSHEKISCIPNRVRSLSTDHRITNEFPESKVILNHGRQFEAVLCLRIQFLGQYIYIYACRLH